MDRMLKDNSGKELSYMDVYDLAYDNIKDSMSRSDLIREYLAHMDTLGLVEWATDEEGNFPEE